MKIFTDKLVKYMLVNLGNNNNSNELIFFVVKSFYLNSFPESTIKFYNLNFLYELMI